MHRYFIIYFSILVLVSCSHSQTSTEKLTGNLKRDISLLLREGKYIVDIMDGIKQTPEQAEIAAKFQKSLQENYSWFVDYMKTVPEGEPLPYHEKMGISKTEYEAFSKAAENIEVISSGQETIQIQKKGEIISFIGKGRLAIFDSILIDLSDISAIYKSYKLSVLDSVRVTDDKKGLKSKWFGYTFTYEEPNNLSLDALKDLPNLNYVKYQLTVGQLEKNRKTFIDFSGKYIENGEKTLEIRLPLVFE